MFNYAEHEAFELEFTKLEELIESYSENHEYYIALSLACNFHIFGYMCPIYEDFAAKKITPVSEFQKEMFRNYIHLDEDRSGDFLFEVEKVFIVLVEIIKTVSDDCKLLLEETIDICKKYSKDGRFIRTCNECYLGVKEGIEGNFSRFEIGGGI